MDGFIVVHTQVDPNNPHIHTDYLINPSTGQQVTWEMIMN